MQTKNFLTIPEFAHELGVTAACIRRWIQERKITTVKVGRLVRIPAAEVTRIVAQGTRPARSRALRGAE